MWNKLTAEVLQAWVTKASETSSSSSPDPALLAKVIHMLTLSKVLSEEIDTTDDLVLHHKHLKDCIYND